MLSILETESGKCDLEHHSAIQKLSSILDLQHTCGYLTLLRTGHSYVPQNQKLEQESVTGDTKVATSVPSALQDKNNMDKTVSPTNGIKDSISAEMLASELDSLEEKMKHHALSPEKGVARFNSTEREKLTLDLGSAYGNTEPTIEKNWVLLDCCFGIPLFSADINKQVCERIVTQDLCSRER